MLRNQRRPKQQKKIKQYEKSKLTNQTYTAISSVNDSWCSPGASRRHPSWCQLRLRSGRHQHESDCPAHPDATAAPDTLSAPGRWIEATTSQKAVTLHRVRAFCFTRLSQVQSSRRRACSRYDVGERRNDLIGTQRDNVVLCFLW